MTLRKTVLLDVESAVVSQVVNDSSLFFMAGGQNTEKSNTERTIHEDGEYFTRRRFMQISLSAWTK